MTRSTVEVSPSLVGGVPVVRVVLDPVLADEVASVLNGVVSAAILRNHRGPAGRPVWPLGPVLLDLADRLSGAVVECPTWPDGHRNSTPDSGGLSTRDVACLLGVSTRSVTRWCRDGRIPATKGTDGQWRIRKDGLP